MTTAQLVFVVYLATGGVFVVMALQARLKAGMSPLRLPLVALYTCIFWLPVTLLFLIGSVDESGNWHLRRK